ncbi:tRNA (cmo5U34)-methyltransferase [Acaryochloris thomasi RCC1774]|uniref:tRNA (Cmo5U34)-methyltransferase n=1 Tax=Acaryochloris thomasi RCC1774 TaxID=1764569 RepID=A0A2W1JUW1_9CYAN|nr:methyltransferase domain-containing protein [Acaryochloris thomasi]PZD74735.1 tRNA (cmo5U34)-methyltransferase [Acaryochloris thomasi RCC1774]
MSESQYQTAWENYWRTLADDQEQAFWDVPSGTELSGLLQYFKDQFDPQLPLVDFGCGNGTQTFFLAEHFPQVLGLDVSAAAIQQARSGIQGNQPTFVVLDATDLQQAQTLHKNIGDANIFIRGVLHQIQAEDRPPVIASLQHLLGNHGQLFLIELSPKAKQLFESLTEQLGAPPPQLARVFQHGIAPAAITPENVRSAFPENRYGILDQGETSISTNTMWPSGEQVQMPAFFMRVGHK